jgi:hypothetical protein
LRIPEKYPKCRYANISQHFQGFKSAALLEIAHDIELSRFFGVIAEKFKDIDWPQ